MLARWAIAPAQPAQTRHLVVVGAHVAEGRLVLRHQVRNVRILRFLQLSEVCRR